MCIVWGYNGIATAIIVITDMIITGMTGVAKASRLYYWYSLTPGMEESTILFLDSNHLDMLN